MATSALARETSPRILIVEDEGLIARDLRYSLEELGYSVTGSARSGQQALDLAAESAVDLVLMDIRIQGDMDGIEAAHIMRERFGLPVVYITAHTDSVTIDRATVSEPFGYIVKPFSNGDLRASIEIALQRQRLHKEIEQKESWLTAVIRSIGDGVVLVDAAGRISFANELAEELLGGSADALRGRILTDLVSYAQEGAELLPEVTNEDIQFLTGTVKRRDGSSRLIVSSIAPIRKQSVSNSEGTVVVMRDISNFRKTEQALRETNWFLSRTNEQLNRLNHAISHDLREPLRNISAATELLATKHEGELTENGQEYLGWIRHGCLRMNHMLSSLLDYYRASHKGEENAVAVNLNVALDAALDNLRFAVESSGAILHVGTLPTVLSHPVAMVQVLQNLVGNAIKYRGTRTPEISIEAELQNGWWTISVQDNGLGFESGQQLRIFELFKRAHGAEISGSGIGLATCQRLIEQYGGRIWGESELGKGATFRFTVPGAQASVPATSGSR